MERINKTNIRCIERMTTQQNEGMKNRTAEQMAEKKSTKTNNDRKNDKKNGRHNEQQIKKNGHTLF